MTSGRLPALGRLGQDEGHAVLRNAADAHAAAEDILHQVVRQDLRRCAGGIPQDGMPFVLPQTAERW